MAGISRRIAVLGGTFDPIHHGHLVAAQEVLHHLDLDCVLFVPAGSPPHKPERPISPAHHRLRMVALAIGGQPAFALSRVDVDRPGPHYTVDSLALLHQQLGPAARLYFVVGSDSLAELPTWHRPDGILELADLVVVERPGVQANLETLEAHLPGLGKHLHRVAMPLLDISSTDLRARVREGRPISFLLPSAVETYIAENGLYRAEDRGA
ncbi:MAG TPA: nicotinate-nucleotide adenylyltransferase [Anaerolineae bacterium]|nr:nicotinate-nucleotide adenylyltransferase [Anaerolineae bacterium]